MLYNFLSTGCLLYTSPNNICWRGCFCSILCSCLLCQILIDRKDLSLFLGSLFCSIGLCACFYAGTRLFWLQWPCNTVWYQVLWSLLLCSSFSKLLQLFGSFMVPYKFLKCLFYTYEICYGYFNRDCIESINCFG